MEAPPFNHIARSLFEGNKATPFSISVGFEFETNKMILLRKKSDILHPMEAGEEQTIKSSPESILSVSTDAPTSLKMKETNRRISEYSKITVNYIVDKKEEILQSRRDHSAITFSHTEFDYLHKKDEQIAIESLHHFLYGRFLESIAAFDDYFGHFSAHDIYLHGRLSRRSQRRAFLNPDLGLNMILQNGRNKNYCFIGDSHSTIDLKIQLTVGCDFWASVMVMIYLYKLYTPDCALANYFRDTVIFVYENMTVPDLNVFNFLVIYLYNFLTHTKRGKSIFFIRTFMAEILETFFTQEGRAWITNQLMSPVYIRYIRSRFPDRPQIIHQYRAFLGFLDKQSDYQGQIQHAVWKTMMDIETHKIFFEFRGFNDILSERLRIFPQRIKERRGSYLNSPVFTSLQL